MGLATGRQMLRAAVFALLVAAPLGLLLGLLRWLSLIVAILLGLAIGSAALVGSGRHRETSIQAIAAGMALVSMVIAGAVMWASIPGYTGFGWLAGMFSHAGFVIPLLVAIIAAVARFRF